MNLDQITITGKNGEQRVCDVLFTFRWEVNGKDYIVYTDNTRDEQGNTKVFASVYDPTGENNQLEELRTQEEWDLIGYMLDMAQEQARAALAAKHEAPEGQ